MTLNTGFVNVVYRLTVQGVGINCKIIAKCLTLDYAISGCHASPSCRWDENQLLRAVQVVSALKLGKEGRDTSLSQARPLYTFDSP